MNGLSRSTLLTIFTQIPTQLFGIIAGVFITRMLGPEGRGLYAIFYADIALFSTFLGFSINSAITYFKAKQAFSEKTLLSVSVLFSIVTVLLSLIILLIWINLPFADLLFPSDHFSAAYILLFLAFIILGQVNSVYSALFQGARRFDVVNKVLLINSVFNLLIFGLTFILHYFDYAEVGLKEVLTIAAFILLINTFQWHRHFKKSFRYQLNLKIKWKNEIKPFFAFMGLGHLSNVINFLNYRLVLWIMAYYLETSQIGVFALGAGLARMINFISNPLAQVLMPFLSAENKKERLKMFGRFARLHFSVILVLGLIGVFLAVPLIPIVYGKEFEESGTVFYLILLGVLLSTQTKQIASFFISSNKLMINLLATMFGFILTFGFNIWFVRDYGIEGAAIAQTITYTGIFLFVYGAMLKFTHFKAKNIFLLNRGDVNYAISELKKKTRGD